MGLFSKTLMEWREPKIKGMMTFKNALTMLGLLALVAIPFGFLGTNGKYSIAISLIAFGFMCLGLLSFFADPLMPGFKIRLREDGIVRAMPTRHQKSAYEDIDSIYFYRNCTHSWVEGALVMDVHASPAHGLQFTGFEVVLKTEAIANGVNGSSNLPKTVHRFLVPTNVSVKKIVQLLQDKGVRVLECQLPA